MYYGKNEDAITDNDFDFFDQQPDMIMREQQNEDAKMSITDNDFDFFDQQSEILTREQPKNINNDNPAIMNDPLFVSDCYSPLKIVDISVGSVSDFSDYCSYSIQFKSFFDIQVEFKKSKSENPSNENEIHETQNESPDQNQIQFPKISWPLKYSTSFFNKYNQNNSIFFWTSMPKFRFLIGWGRNSFATISADTIDQWSFIDEIRSVYPHMVTRVKVVSGQLLLGRNIASVFYHFGFGSLELCDDDYEIVVCDSNNDKGYNCPCLVVDDPVPSRSMFVQVAISLYVLRHQRFPFVIMPNDPVRVYLDSTKSIQVVKDKLYFFTIDGSKGILMNCRGTVIKRTTSVNDTSVIYVLVQTTKFKPSIPNPIISITCYETTDNSRLPCYYSVKDSSVVVSIKKMGSMIPLFKIVNECEIQLELDIIARDFVQSSYLSFCQYPFGVVEFLRE